jgi:hypothetical protein
VFATPAPQPFQYGFADGSPNGIAAIGSAHLDGSRGGPCANARTGTSNKKTMINVGIAEHSEKNNPDSTELNSLCVLCVLWVPSSCICIAITWRR